MSDLVLRPRSATEMIDAAFQIYRRSPAAFMLSVALLYVPWFALSQAFLPNMSQPRTSLPPGFTSVVIIGSVVSILLYALSAGVVSVLTRAAYLDEPIDVAGAFRRTFGKIFQLVPAAILQAVLLVIGLVLFIIPGCYVFARLFAVLQVIVLEDAGVMAAFGRSGVLSRGRKLAILGTIVLVVLLTWIANVGALMLFSLLPGKALSAVLMIAVSVVVLPLVGITQTVLYFDSRIRNEGFDVEYLARAGAGAAPATGMTA